MNEFWIGIFGGLIGSILTVVVTKLLDIFHTRKSHQYELEKKFFERKLNAAETATAQCNILLSSLINMELLYERYNNEYNKVEEFIQDNIYQQGMQQLELANNASFILTNSISLYFDFKTDYNQNQIIKEFYNSLSSLGPLFHKTNLTFEQYKTSIGTLNQEKTYSLYQKTEEELGEKMKDVSKSIKNFSNELQKLVEQMRIEMKKFEY